MAPLSIRNLLHDKVRLAVTLTGVVFAVVLVAIEIGLFVGFATATTNLIDHSGVDLWIASKGVPYIEGGASLSERKYYRVLATPGVGHAEKYIVRFSRWKRPDGSEESAQIVGFNPDTGTGGPWRLVEGSIPDLKMEDTVIIDRLYAKRLGVFRRGETVEIRGRRARVVGFTSGIRTFTTMPMVFTSFKNALNYTGLGEDETVYILVKAAAGADVKQLQRLLASRLDGVDAMTTKEFAGRTRNYWMFSTGAGVAVLMAAALGLIVGIAVVAQTIYAATMDHIREYGTLKAIGASNGYIYRVILEQAVASAFAGYVLGIAVAVMAEHASRTASAQILLPWPVRLALLGLTLAMCMSASVVSIRKATTIDPVMVFRG